MPARASYDFATIRIVPRVDREEFINAGVILFCLERKFLRALVRVDEVRLRALDADFDAGEISRHVQAIPLICEGAGGPIGAMTIRERFHWLVAPRSAAIQISPVHSGLCMDPEETLVHLFQRLVA